MIQEILEEDEILWICTEEDEEYAENYYYRRNIRRGKFYGCEFRNCYIHPDVLEASCIFRNSKNKPLNKYEVLD